MSPVQTGAASAISASQAASTITVTAGTSAAALQAIINAAPEGATITMEAGTYRFTQTVVIDRDGITLQGSGQVTIVADDSLQGAPAIRVGSALFQEVTEAPVGLAADAMAGTRQITLEQAGQVHVGDVIWIERPNDDALFDAIDDTLWRDDKPLRTGMAVVTAVNGSTVTLDRDLPFDFDAETATVEVLDVVQDVTIRGIDFAGDYGTANPGRFTNTLRGEDGAMMLLINTSVGTVLEDVDITQPASNGVVIAKTLDAAISDVSVTGAHNKGAGGNGYAFWIRDVYDSSFTGLTAVDTRHAVLFASYTSASGNHVQVDYTNRDINFHGGLAHSNVVEVDVSVRSTLEQGYLAASTFFNPGTGYGAPTDPTTNLITFGTLVGTVRGDNVTGNDRGATLSTLGGNDTVRGGAGDDRIDTGTGHDIIHATGGQDTINGGQGTDTLVMDMNRSEAIVLNIGGRFEITTVGGTMTVTGIETLRFDDGAVAPGAMVTATLRGLIGFDRQTVTTSVVADALVDAITMGGGDDLAVMGNGLANNVIGNDGDNLILGMGGDDRLFGGRGDDRLDGGTGNDVLHGGAGRDTLLGGAGNDTMIGRQGADVFVASQGVNTVEDFSIRDGDMVRFDGYDTEDLVQALGGYLSGSLASADEFVFAVTRVNGVTGLQITSDAGDSLTLDGVSATGLYQSLIG